MRLKEPGSDGAPRIAVVVALPEQKLDAVVQGTGIDRSKAQQALEMVTRHEAVIKLMSKESNICICVEGIGNNLQTVGETATAVITPHVRVIGRLVERKLQNPNRDTAVVSKLEKELAKVQRIVTSEGYRRGASDAVKEADRRRSRLPGAEDALAVAVALNRQL
ncbi:hypothetical protein H4R24_003745 [Coemansia sp. RSA 988]|nr:hypothetical protein H4R24_003745 [Coemansia sp. RSA 988]